MSRLHVVVTWEDHVYIVDAENGEQATLKVRGEYDPPLGDEDVQLVGVLGEFTKRARQDGAVRLNF